LVQLVELLLVSPDLSYQKGMIPYI
jgi:hypothetical protein